METRMIFLLVLVDSLFLSIIFNAYPQVKNVNVSSTNFVHSNKIDRNNIEMYFNNWGESHTPYFQSGGFWQIPSEQNQRQIIFDQAPWIVGKRNGEIVLAGGQWSFAYSPGPIINGQAAMLIQPEDSLKYRVYKINRGDNNSNPDYAEWPVEFGAPIDEMGKPLILGDQTLWTSYNYLDSNLVYPFYPSDAINPLEVEIHQTVFSREGSETDYQDIFSNVIFIEYEIIYKGNDPIDSAFFGFWTDIDFDPYWDNRPAVDVPLDLGYCWTDDDSLFDGTIPISIGYTMLYGPAVPEIGGRAIFRGKILNDYKNIQLNSFHGIGYDYPDDSMFTYIRSIDDAWNYSIGLNQNGNPFIDPTTNQQTTFPLSGDPVNNSGWIFQNTSTSGEAGLIMFAGPFSIATNDTQWTMLALVPGLGNSNLNSITTMREKVQILRSLPYDSIAFGSTNYFITDTEKNFNSLPEKFSLSQNYPNPFNPRTKISWQSPVAGNQTLKVYDVLGNEVASLVDEYRNAGSYEIDFNPASSIKNPASGVYFYQLKAGEYLETKKMLLIK